MSIDYIDLVSSDDQEEYTPMKVIDLTQVDDSIATRTSQAWILTYMYSSCLFKWIVESVDTDSNSTTHR
jgi:hypothetical protein